MAVSLWPAARLVAGLACGAVATLATGTAPDRGSSSGPAILGLDHIPLAVANLDAAAERYRALGFSLKSGRLHANGIRNQHVKFKDGTEIELLEAPFARDALTGRYVDHLGHGDGPAFVSFFSPDLNRLAGTFGASGRTFRRSGGTITLEDRHGLGYIFFGPRNASPTDRPEHFDHMNGADALIGVWIANDDLSAERTLLSSLGIEATGRIVHVPDPARALVATLAQGEVLFLPASRQMVAGRKIVGATLQTRSLDGLRRVLAREQWKAAGEVRTAGRHSLFLPPELTHGMWLEFRCSR